MESDKHSEEQTGTGGEQDEGDDHSQFNKQRLKLIAEIEEASGKLYTNVNALNRNIESVNLVGRQFENVHNLWSKFEQVMSAPSSTSAVESTSTSASPAPKGQND
ncbi:hypothetical protein PCANC_09587 [Puccinia coronata f. sp. avenae]|uniref:DASH complex subunit DAD1 n=1 Tax=Puccinia coronata f. sp. avenae TaxID=200324 RepID=A0A2N5V9U2_9BASI|nr:hypothetical protein PCANC_18351 [Puccinia coronata f. sp. avenae]PLW46741.1 hypothetical protein PCANC_09587 [Puccinia coronata f. sp. avenae]